MKETPHTVKCQAGVRQTKELVFILSGRTVGASRGERDILGPLESTGNQTEPYG